MPFVRVQLIEGRTAEQKKKMAEEIIETLHEHGDAKRESVHVIFEDMAHEDYHNGAKK